MQFKLLHRMCTEQDLGLFCTHRHLKQVSVVDRTWEGLQQPTDEVEGLLWDLPGFSTIHKNWSPSYISIFLSTV